MTRDFYFEWIVRLMKHYFPSLAENHSAALPGYGSEVLGNDDEISEFYGWGPKPKIFLTNQDYVEYGSKLQEMFLRNYHGSIKGYPARFKLDPMDGLPKPTKEEDGFSLVTIYLAP